jgi:PIN domain nuclease of toxin-antitoxin system
VSNLLLDTHTLLWWVTNSDCLLGVAKDAIGSAGRVVASEVSL